MSSTVYRNPNGVKMLYTNINKWVYKIISGKVQDRTDGKLVHLDGLNFSRAYNLYSIIINLNATTKATTNLK
jgi:hypothetical protein